MVLTREIETLIYRIEGCAFTARMDAQTLEIGADRTSYFADVARYNRENVGQLSVLVKELYELLTFEDRQFGNIEECPFCNVEVGDYGSTQY